MMATKSPFQSGSLQRRLTRLVFFIVMTIFAVIGVIALFAVRDEARAEISQQQRAALTDLSRQLNGEFERVVEDLRRLATSANARRFAGETITVASSGLEAVQQRLLGDFVALAQQQPDRYLEIRYVTRSGSVWTTASSDGGIVTDARVYLNLLSGDDALLASLRQEAGQVALGALKFQTDASGQPLSPPRPILRFSAPVAAPNDNTNIPGVIQIDVDATPVLDLVNLRMVSDAEMSAGHRLMMVNALGQILADSAVPENTYPRLGMISEQSAFSIQQPALEAELRAHPDDVTALQAGSAIFSTAGMNVGGAPDMPWRLILVEDARAVLGPSDTLSIVTLLFCLALGAASSLLTGATMRRMLRPLDAAGAIARQWSAADGAAQVELSGAPDDEIGQLIQAFQQSSGQMRQLREELRIQVDRYTRNMEIAARISRETAALHDIDQLLNRAVDLIVEEFGFYHVQVFLVDDVGLNAVLLYSHGEAGRRLLEQGHKIAVGSQSVIGAVTHLGEPVIINDTADRDMGPHRFNPLLPDTRAEMALPMQSGERIIGALDVQSTQPDVFHAEEVRTFQLLADQIAIAIQNARLLMESEQRIGQIDALNRQLTRRAWESADIAPENAYRYDLFNVERARADDAPPSGLATPISIRGEVIGTLAAAVPEAMEYAEDDQLILRAVADRVALAIENARLFQETQASLSQTSVLYQISRFLNEADTLDDIVHAIITAAMPDAIRGQVGIFHESGTTLEWLEINADWGSAQGSAFQLGLVGMQLHLPDHPILRDMQPNRITLITDTERDARIDDILRTILAGIGARAVALIPFSVRGVWRGVILIEFPQTREFSDSERRIFTTLIDQAGVAIDNRLLLQQTEIALSQVERLYSASRIINTAQSMHDLIRAAVTTTNDETLDFALGIFEGETDSTGYPNRLLMVARSNAGVVIGDNLIYDISIPLDSTLRIREPQVILDLNMDDAPPPSLLHLIRAQGARFGAVFPLFSGDQPIALFFITSPQPRELMPDDYEVYRALTGQMSTVLENRRLLEQTEIALQETSVLYQASRALGDAITPQDILGVAVNYVVDATASLAFLAMLAGDDWNVPGAFMHIVSSWQHNPEQNLGLSGVTLTPEQFPAWRLLATPDILMIDDIEQESSLTAPERRGIASLGIQALVVLPLRAGRRALGAILIGARKPRRYGERDLRIYRSFTEQASIKLEAARLLQQTERRARQLATSAEVSRFASTILDLDVLLPRIVDLIHLSFGYDHAQIFLMSADRQFAELQASTGEAGRQLLSIGHRLEKGSSSVIGQVTATGEPSVVLDTSAAGVVHRPNPYLPNTRSEMAVPLILKGEVVGALDVQSNQPFAFDEDDVAVLTTLASQVSVAIDNAGLFEQARRRASEMSFLFDVTTVAASATTLTGALQNVAGQLHDSLNALSVSIYLPELYMDSAEKVYTIMRPVALAGSEQPLSELAEVNITSDTHNLIATVAETRAPAIIGDIEAETRYLPVAASARSAILVPLAAGSQLIGLVTMESAQSNAYDDSTLQLLLTLSGSLSAVVQNQQLLEQVQKTNEQLREVDRLKSDFLANMSHELRTPLNSIIGFSRVILKGIDGPLTEMQEQDLTTIYTSGQHLLNLINDILDQAKISAGKMDLQFEYFDMKAVIDGVRSIGIGLVKDKPVDIRVEIETGLPRAYGDEFRTRQVLLNLVSNAAKFTREGSITITVYGAQNDETATPMIRVDVTDTGIGIAEKDIPLLFEAFRQVDSSLTRTVGGTGLGLPIAKSLIEMQGGEMLVRSQLNVGSTFSILMPVEPPANAGRDQPRATAETASVNGSSPVYDTQPPARPPKANETIETPMIRPPMLVKRQILIIEDNPDMLDQFRRILGREGFEIFAASIPLEAEAMASGLHPTLIIMDVNFVEGAGWQILNKLKSREDTMDIPVIVVSLSDEVDLALEAGAFRFIHRPFMPDALLEAVQSAEHESRVDRILIIDDQPESVRLLEDLLREQGDYRVFSARGGHEGMAMVARRRPDLVILDLRMPEMDGFAVVDELRSNPETANIPILVVTGDTLNYAERERLNKLDIVFKPDINAQTYQQFLSGVKARLAKFNGD